MIINRKYIILPLALLMLAGCSDKTDKPQEEETSEVTTTIDSPTTNISGNGRAHDNPITQDPITQDPITQDPITQDPITQDPITQDPITQDPITQDPITQDPITQDPITQDPVIPRPRNTRSRIVEEDDNETEIIGQETIPSNWYIRIIAEDSNRSLKTNLSQLGELEENDAVQKHTIRSHGRFSNPYLDVIFIDPDGMPTGNYQTNYHVYGEGIDDNWHFTVVTDDSNAEIHLSWSGLYLLTPFIDGQNRTQYSEYRSSTNLLITKMKLIDNTTGVEIPVINNGEKNIYIFNMNGQVSRSFEWVLQYD